MRAAAADRRGRGVPTLPGRRPRRPDARSRPAAPAPARAQPRRCAAAGRAHQLRAGPRLGRRTRCASACRAVIAVLASGAELGEPPWDAADLRQFLISGTWSRCGPMEFLTDQGLARGNPQAAFELWLAPRLAALPAPFAAEVRTWTEALQGRGPRAGRPRQPTHHPGIPAHPAGPAGQLGRAV